EPARSTAEPNDRQRDRQQAEADERKQYDEYEAEPRQKQPPSTPQQQHPVRDHVLRAQAEQVHAYQWKHVHGKEQEERGERAGERPLDAPAVGGLEVGVAPGAERGGSARERREALEKTAVRTGDRH